jgi:hypothetical protein
MFMGGGKEKFKDDLQSLATQKIRALGVYPINITPELKTRINNVREDFLDARQTKKFTEERGITIMREIDAINKELAALPKKDEEDNDDIFEMRKKKARKAKVKRKTVTPPKKKIGKMKK